ncbi:hypothetical protein N7489_005078 [Penicillium chrysogenum]|uniref:Rhamnolipids biosynthesis 3-oxoacyl-[acyl-carrier-protein] reductase n=1 Tax=Penicillium chrysogenum TaxID=5076 RepID=A0ABQ8WES1_PENCH|nr:uncharacterized protein N7489_005078 [Penicillium chrysogenum]KAJ5244982.1 hypothetical protein N7489_005078 [Penicillium chrysogenum]KAJ5264794.1 hypothetical protein N7505_007587 [Penicillium chrysogenum]KAJ5849174.1 hypothetical protein N7534_007863 [Penicillium rubens]
MPAQESNRSFKLETLFNLKGRVALVTGGGSGIGLMATRSLAVNGAKVYITGRTKEKLDRVAELYSKEPPGQIIPIAADVTPKESIQKLVDEISAKESKLPILINNADQEDPKALQEQLFKNQGTVQEWEEVMRTNVTQLFFTTTAFLPLLNKGTENEHGWSSTVVNIS